MESARRVGIERARVALSDDDDEIPPEPLDGFLEIGNDELSRLQGLDDLVLAGREHLDSAVLESLPKAVFHDLTPYGFGVLADSAQGGLRLDLTSYFEGGNPSPPPELPAFSDGRIADWTTAFGASAPLAPKWRFLRDFYRLGKRVAGSTIQARPTTEDQHGIYPIAQQMGLSFGVSSDTVGGSRQGEYTFFPFIVLWNPYNVALEGDYQIDFEFSQFWRSRFLSSRRV